MNYRLLSVLLILAWATGCGGGSGEGTSTTNSASDGLTAEQLEKGIGPVSSVELKEIDPALAARGEEIFTVKCTACHKFDERYVGPPLGDVLDRRTPEFIMNMMLNSDEMVKSHPSVKELLAQYMTPMPNQQLTEQDARAVLEYFRQVKASSSGS